MDVSRVTRIVRDIIVQGGFDWEVVAVQEQPGGWRVSVRDRAHRVVTFDAPKGTPIQVREAIVNSLDAES